MLDDPDSFCHGRLPAPTLLPVHGSQGMADRSVPDTVQMQAGQDGTSCIVASTTLLQGNKVVSISHNGEIYRLRSTKLGKLILTK